MVVVLFVCFKRSVFEVEVFSVGFSRSFVCGYIVRWVGGFWVGKCLCK